MLSEFEIIRRFFTRPAPSAVLGVGDDAALLRVAPGMELAVSTDMLVAGRHFFPDADPGKLGHKALAVNLSDMAAMGAKPRWATLSLALPEADEKWLESFAGGFMALAAAHGVELVGGDTTRGPLNICVQVMGEVPEGQALRRSGAKPGDDVWVSGRLGDAALALAHMQHRIVLEPHDVADCLKALHAPEPRVALGLALRGVAHSAIDVSDGLAADLGHILECSGVAAVVEIAAVPRSAALERHFGEETARQALLAGGDDYELCFTADVDQRSAIEKIGRDTGVAVTCVGRIARGSGLAVTGSDGKPLELRRTGFDHFR
ncbi:MAG: thiamine-phosphate kinase [Betaproteobacteria bacterium]|nr:thiamine-phosphate kinase [Betaproteobacteria bacterium]